MRFPLRAGRAEVVTSIAGSVALTGLSAGTSKFFVVDHTSEASFALAELPAFGVVTSGGVTQGYVRACLDGLSGTGFTAELWLLAGASISSATLTWTRKGILA